MLTDYELDLMATEAQAELVAMSLRGEVQTPAFEAMVRIIKLVGAVRLAQARYMRVAVPSLPAAA